MPLSAAMSPERIAAALQGYCRNLESAAEWAEPSWACALIGLQETAYSGWRDALRRAGVMARTTCSRALAHAAGVRPPEFSTFSKAVVPSEGQAVQPNLALLDALSIEHGLAVLRMRALRFRRAEVRRLIDRRARARLAEWTGTQVDRLEAPAQEADAPDIVHLIAKTGMLSIEQLDASALAAEGWYLLVRDAGGERDDKRSQMLLRLALPRSLTATACLPAKSGQDASGSAWLFSHVPQLLPETGWLFG